MVKKLFKLLILLFIITSSSSFATNRWHVGYIDKVYPLGNGTIVVYMDKQNVHCLNANGDSKNSFYLTVGQGPTKVTELGLKNIYSSALIAFTTQKRVQVYFDDTRTSCYIDRILMHGS